MSYEIVNKIIVHEGIVTVEAAPSHLRPLVFVCREDTTLSNIFQTEGLHGLLTAISRKIYRGTIRPRANSTLTRLLRTNLHRITLEVFQRLDEDTAVEALASMTEKMLLDRDYIPTVELHAIHTALQGRGAERIAPAKECTSTVKVRLFGLFEVENDYGNVAENPATRALPWLLLKYLMCNRGREVDQEELLQHIWADKSEGDPSNACRVRLRRMRESLDAIHLGGRKGLILYCDGKYSLNPQYSIQTDESQFMDCITLAKGIPLDDPAGLQACTDALTLIRGKFLAHTHAADWFMDYRAYYEKEFTALAHSTMERMIHLGDMRAAELLSDRAIKIVPENKGLHQSILRFLMEQKCERELVRYVAQLSQVGTDGVEWLNEYRI